MTDVSFVLMCAVLVDEHNLELADQHQDKFYRQRTNLQN